MSDFDDSDLFADWQSELADSVEGGPVHRQLHGLKAFSRVDGRI
ncbi:MAG: hypothetical protein AAGJ40_19080 [Planctomycetota bacterium]